ncbi:MAG TPA: Stp1/IreP family PP2C-type Ser/Thr phosphatase [Terriglobales bacterium]|nr:Stp1/IreP family PP2C-type Ser/Thr phosphatase [Terriglobales bacterium]
MSFSVEVAGKTDVGCHRTNNEDNFGYDTRYGIFVVCDGMGGQAAGEVASKMAVETVLTYFKQSAKNGTFPIIGKEVEGVSDRAKKLASAIHLANEAIRAAAQEHAAKRGMGSTIVSVFVEDGFFSVAHVGDSRIYLVRHGEMQQLTQDHSLVMEQVRRGLLTREEAEKSEAQNIILRALGSEEHEPDLDDQIAQQGDLLLLATDGLTKLVSDDKILEIIKLAPSLNAAVEQLIQAAKDAGGDDNVTCMLVRLERLPWYKQLFRGFRHAGGPQWQNSF